MRSQKGVSAQRKKLGERIRRLRNGRGWSQAELASLCGMSAHHLGKIERGAANVTLATLLPIAKSFSITLSDLFDGLL